jgi:hypothetical protein
MPCPDTKPVKFEQILFTATGTGTLVFVRDVEASKPNSPHRANRRQTEFRHGCSLSFAPNHQNERQPFRKSCNFLKIFLDPSEKREEGRMRENWFGGVFAISVLNPNVRRYRSSRSWGTRYLPEERKRIRFRGYGETQCMRPFHREKQISQQVHGFRGCGKTVVVPQTAISFVEASQRDVPCPGFHPGLFSVVPDGTCLVGEPDPGLKSWAIFGPSLRDLVAS